MRAQPQQRKMASFSPAAPVAKGLLQRQCACGGSPGPGGECAECRRQRLLSQPALAPGKSAQANGAATLKRAPAEVSPQPSWGHSFARLRVDRPDLHASHQLGLENGETDRYSADGVLMTLAGSGTCQNGGGASVCDLATGDYKITSNSNTCCTKDCTQAHEQTHVDDANRWGCCKTLSEALKKPGANRNDLVTKYNDWLAKVSPLTECNAYTNDVRCAGDLAKAKGCDTDEGKRTDCCKDIADYQARYGALAATNCAAAPKAAPPCPAF